MLFSRHNYIRRPHLSLIHILAQIFGVSTDYLLKDELAEAEYTKSDDSSSVRRVPMEEANAFLQVKQATAGRIAFATFLCILSPICLFLLAAASETGMLPIRETVSYTQLDVYKRQGIRPARRRKHSCPAPTAKTGTARCSLQND